MTHTPHSPHTHTTHTLRHIFPKRNGTCLFNAKLLRKRERGGSEEFIMDPWVAQSVRELLQNSAVKLISLILDPQQHMSYYPSHWKRNEGRGGGVIQNVYVTPSKNESLSSSSLVFSSYSSPSCPPANTSFPASVCSLCCHQRLAHLSARRKGLERSLAIITQTKKWDNICMSSDLQEANANVVSPHQTLS